LKREKGTADFRCPFCIYASKTISRVLYLTVIYLDVPLPVRSSHPGSGRASLGTRSPCSHTGVAPDRVYSDGLFPAIECALTALFHPYRQGYALAVSRFLTESVAAADDCNREEGPFVPLHTTPLRFPLGERSSTPASYQHGAALAAVYLCCTFPEVAFGGRYPLSLPCGARTFLMNRLSPCPRDCLAYSHEYCTRPAAESQPIFAEMIELRPGMRYNL